MTSTASRTDPAPVQTTAWAWIIGTFFYMGRLKPGPGTWASVATVLLWRWLAPSDQNVRFTAAIIASVAVTIIGIPAATRVARESNRKDPGFVVIDEVAGQLIALIGAPLGWKTLLASLILFRAFDIMKPPPLRRLEQIPEGAGIMLDDVGAGCYALVVLQLLRRFSVLP